MFDSGSVFDSSGNEQDSQFTYPDMPAPGPMPAGFGPIRTLAGPQGPQGPHDAYAPLSDMPLLSSDSSPEPTRVAEGELQDMFVTVAKADSLSDFSTGSMTLRTASVMVLGASCALSQLFTRNVIKNACIALPDLCRSSK